MKTIILAAAIAATLAGPAFAASNKVHNLHHDRQFRNANGSVLTNDPIGAYVDGREIGRDPDPHIRDELQREYYTLQGN